MRILIYGLNFSPELTGIGKYTGEMASWLAECGHEVRVVAAPPYYPAWQVREDYRGRWFRTEHPLPRLTVFRTPLYVPGEPSGLKRLLHLFSFMLGSIPRMVSQIFWMPEVVWTVEPTFFGAPLALFVARAAGAPAWLHVQDYEVDAAFDLDLLPSGGMIHRIAGFLEGFFTCAFDRVSSISAQMVSRGERKGLPADRLSLFPNWVDTDAITPTSTEESNPFREELGLAGKTVFLYSGNMGNKQGLELLPTLARAFALETDVHFVFCGDGAFRPQLERLVEGLGNVSLLPLQPVDRLNALLNAANVHLLPQRAGAADLVMPSKLTGMLSSGRPVLATAEPGTMLSRVLLGATGEDALGVVVSPGDSAAFVAGARLLIKEDGLREALGRNARDYALCWLGRNAVLSKFEHDLRDAYRHETLEIV